MKPLVITKIYGGLGNQLFQYAVARNIAKINNTQLKLDVTPFREYKLRVFGLSHFNIIAELASESEIRKLKKGNQLLRLSNHLWKYRIFPKTYYQEKSYYHFDINLLRFRGSLYLDGYWQSEKYFKDIEPIIREEFRLRDTPGQYSLNIAAEIKQCDAINLHIRRGDYVSNPEANRHHGVCSLSYYYEAVKLITKNLTHPHFFR